MRLRILRVVSGLFFVSHLASTLFAEDEGKGEARGAEMSYVVVRTRSKIDPAVRIWYRVPSGYKRKEGRLSRVLVLFGGRNCDGEKQAKGMLGFDEWADELGVFLVAPGFRDDDYWHPKKWSGKALLNGLKMIAEKYPLCLDKLLYYGYSAGSQCSNLFPAWKPKICRAWVSHACGVWHKPTKRERDVPGLVTCGEADIGRYQLSRMFVLAARRAGCDVLWKSFANVQHDVPPESVRLAKAFLKHHHLATLDDLEIKKHGRRKRKRARKSPVLFVGDDQEGRYWPADDPATAEIDHEEKVEFRSEDLAMAWGKPARKGKRPIVKTGTISK